MRTSLVTQKENLMYSKKKKTPDEMLIRVMRVSDILAKGDGKQAAHKKTRKISGKTFLSMNCISI